MRSLGGDCLSLVTELPLRITRKPLAEHPGSATNYLAYRDLIRAGKVTEASHQFGLAYLPHHRAVQAQTQH